MKKLSITFFEGYITTHNILWTYNNLESEVGKSKLTTFKSKQPIIFKRLAAGWTAEGLDFESR
jgi:hypothetical protein